MKNSGPIIIVDDDADDQFILREVIEKLEVSNGVLCFPTAIELLAYLRVTHDKPFIILCDINMPEMDGLELRRHINDDPYLRQKSIPFVFFTTGASPSQIREAYSLTVQGLFLKEPSFADAEQTLRLILQYWDRCKHPNSVSGS